MSTPDPAATDRVQRPLDLEAIRAQFPILTHPTRGEAHVFVGKPLVYLDNAASVQKPLAVVDAIRDFYLHEYSNVHRGVHTLSQLATDRFEAAREKVRAFLNAAHTEEIVFVRGATEGINLVAQTFGRQHLGRGDEVLVSAMEHHSDIVPWQMLCQEVGASLRVIPMDDDGVLDLDAYARLLGPRTKLVGIVQVSNALGTINPVREMIATAHEAGVPVLVDAAQSVPHMPVDVRDLDCDFLVFSGHKIYGPSGIGALYGKRHHLEAMPPWQGGGDMILSVRFEQTRYNELPYKFEAGTPNIAGVIGLGAALDWVGELGLDRIAAWESELLDHGTRLLQELPYVRIVGQAPHKAGVLSFVMENVHPHDLGSLLDGQGIAIRAGHHCAQPVMERLGIAATARASLAVYNTKEELLALAAALPRIQELLG